MKESILFAPSLNGTEFIRTMAGFGVNTLGFRIMTAVELAETALMHAGMAADAAYVSKKEGPSVIYGFFCGSGYFRAASYADAENIFRAINEIRFLIPHDEKRVMKEKLPCGEFAEKNTALLEVYCRYMDFLETGNKVDDIVIIRKAAEEADAFDADFIVAEEYPLRPLEKALLERVSGGHYRRVSVPQLFGIEPSGIPEADITEAYGRINEVSHIVSEIYSGGIPLDKCIVACSNPGVYSQVFYDVAASYGIPVTYGCGLPVLNSYPARFLKCLYEWNTSGFNGADALKKLVYSDEFSRRELAASLGVEKADRKMLDCLCETAGNLRISFDAETNRKRIEALKGICSTEEELAAVKYAEIFASEIEKGWSYFTDRYSVRRIMPDGSMNLLDTAAVRLITETIEGYVRNVPDGDVNSIVPDILKKRILTENSAPGSLHVTSVGGAVASLRKNLYVCGLSSLEFPGSSRENYIMLDSDVKLFDESVTAPTSVNRVKRKKEELDCLLKTAGALGVRTSLSYSGYSLAELREQNPSSELYRIYESLHSGSSMDDFRNSVRFAGYFDDGLSLSGAAAGKYSDGCDVPGDGELPQLPESANVLDRQWSPSALEVFRQCPRRFYLSKLWNADETEPDNPMTVIDRRDKGQIAHSLMEKLGAGGMSRDEFLRAAADAFDRVMIKRPPVIEQSAGSERQAFIEMMGMAYDRNPGHEIVSSEEMAEAEHDTGVRLYGRSDRIERCGDGSLIIADFKSGHNVIHEENDFETCMQIIVYAWICEKNGINVCAGEYRYLKHGITVGCRYDDDMKAELTRFLERFRSAAENGMYPPNASVKNCRYCNVQYLCESIRRLYETEVR